MPTLGDTFEQYIAANPNCWKRPNDATQGYAADWTIAQLHEPAQRIVDRIDELMRQTASLVDAGA